MTISTLTPNMTSTKGTGPSSTRASSATDPAGWCCVAERGVAVCRSGSSWLRASLTATIQLLPIP